MNSAIFDPARIQAPPAFLAAVHHAAHEAVNRPAGRRLSGKRLALLIALCLLLSGAAAAAIATWTADDLFSKESGFMLPAYEWGSAPDAALENTVVLYEQTGSAQYQFENGGLVSIAISFHPQNQKDGSLRTDLYRRLYDDLCRLFGPPMTNEMAAPQKNALQQALRDHLNAPADSEGERMGKNLENSGADDNLIQRAQRAADQTVSLLQNAWQDEKTHTALSLMAEFLPSGEIRVLTLSLSQFSP